MLNSRSLSLPLHRALFHTSTGRFALQTVNVPSMGDSISEGTLVEIVKKTGDPVNADDVVLVLETDKVSVDVTSPVAGTIIEVYAQLEENVEVGKPLFTLDDTLIQSDSSNKSVHQHTTSQSSKSAAATGAVAVAADVVTAGRRTPLIEFLGKRSLLPMKPSSPSKPLDVNLPSPVRTIPVQSSSGHVLPFTSAKRLPLSPAEVESINSGLAFL
ncbi:unnamed protein product [Peronospora belbahrii]|uniref:Lipoyl-binding domain-containing protein n=1 Tax=Peronospora belbahrii TaxID=622444 RepID=A0AAU9L3Z8_9STRA|nr:unnamed protein product [Peronospora belbahrii]CAH0520129.1 unnamed protein product [Peronospora belbahrii]